MSSPGGRFALASFCVTLSGAIAAWLVVPGIADRLPWADSKVGKLHLEPAQPKPTEAGAIPPKIQPPHSVVLRQRTAHYLVTLASCRLEDAETIICRGYIKNTTGAHRGVRLYTGYGLRSSTLVDSAGIARIASKCWLARDNGYTWSYGLLAPNVNYYFAIQFPIRGTINHAQIVDLYFNDDDPQWRAAQTLNIRFDGVPVAQLTPQRWWRW